MYNHILGRSAHIKAIIQDLNPLLLGPAYWVTIFITFLLFGEQPQSIRKTNPESYH
jgi:hypothetical protein